jgi:hypothetical protein
LSDEVAGAGDAILVLGEIHTGLLQSSSPLPVARCEHILASFRGERVRSSQRPIAYAVSPDLFTGVDCRLASPSGLKLRGIGTVSSHAAMTGGHVLQASAATALVRPPGARRQPWSHYLARPGRIEVIGRGNQDDLVSGFLASKGTAGTLDLGAISTRLMDSTQVAANVDRRPPFPAPRTKLRWAAVLSDSRPTQLLRFTVEAAALRTVLISCPPGLAGSIRDFAEDLALHDWLLSTLIRVTERSRIGMDARPEVLERLRPAVDHLLHLWMPAARAEQTALMLWEGLERRPGLSRQWHALVDRIRDQVALGTIALLSAGRG